MSLPARDALHAAVMMNREVEWIATYDRDSTWAADQTGGAHLAPGQ